MRTRGNVLRPIPGDPCGAEQHHWNTGGKKKTTVEPRWAKQQTKKLRPKPTKTSSPKGNDRSPESNVPRSNLISKNIEMGHGNQRPKIELVQALMPVLVTSNFDDYLIKNEKVAWRTIFPLQVYGKFFGTQGQLTP